MTAAAARTPNPTVLAAAGLLGLAAAVLIRVRIAGPAGPASVPAGLSFGLALMLLAAVLGERPSAWRGSGGAAAVGLAGAAVLCAPVIVRHLAEPGYTAPAGLAVTWAAGVTLVAIAEEALLRGAVYRLIVARHGTVPAIAVTAVAFALLHAPVYGWAVVPLDLAVGVWLGVLRHLTGSVVAPAVAHTVADLAGWWLR